MTERLKQMVRTYKENGDRVDEVLFQEVNAAIAFTEYLQEVLQTKNERDGGMNNLTSKIEVWAHERNLLTADPVKQMLKLFEEVGEISAALARGNMQEAFDGIGDADVVLTILARQLGSSLEECTALAYNEIKDRKGKMIDGIFIKEADLK